MEEIIFMIQELNQQQSLFSNRIYYCAKLLQEYYQMAKPAVEEAGLTVDFTRMEKQIDILKEMLAVMEKELGFEDAFEVVDDEKHQSEKPELHISIEKIQNAAAKLNARDQKLQKLVNDVQQFDESLRFDETYEDIMVYVSRLRKNFADYHMISEMVCQNLLSK